MKLVYLFNIDGTSIYKIGVTKGDPKKRLKNLQVGCPFPLIITHIYHSKYGNKLEGILHRTYQLNKITDEDLEPILPGIKLHGEWFQLPKDIVLGFLLKCKEVEDRISFLKKNSTLDKI